MRRNLVAVFALALLAPYVAEFLLGDQYLSGQRSVGSQLAMFVALGLWYGPAAVLIREVTRRTGRGWPTILLLGLAFGLVEEGLLTQSLFNPHYLGLDLISYGHVGWLGTGLPWAVFVLTLHVVWSIATPVALVEASWPDREPWLGRIGLAVTAVVLLLGAAVIFAVSWSTSGFVAPVGRLSGVALLAVITAVAAFRMPRLTQPWPPGPVLPAAVASTVAASAFQLLHHYGWQIFPAWLTMALTVVLLGGTAAAVLRWRWDVLGLAIGPMLTYCWVGLINAIAVGPAGIIEQLAIVLVALSVTALAVWRRRSATAITSGTGADAAATAASR